MRYIKREVSYLTVHTKETPASDPSVGYHNRYSEHLQNNVGYGGPTALTLCVVQRS